MQDNRVYLIAFAVLVILTALGIMGRMAHRAWVSYSHGGCGHYSMTDERVCHAFGNKERYCVPLEVCDSYMDGTKP